MICRQLSHSALVVRQGDILPKPNLSPYHDQKVSKKRFDPDLEAPMQKIGVLGAFTVAQPQLSLSIIIAWHGDKSSGG